MKEIKQGDVLKFTGDTIDKEIFWREVRGVCGSVIFTRDVIDGGYGPTELNDIEDLVTFGWVIEK